MDLKDLDDAFSEMIRKFPEAREELIQSEGKKLHERVLRNIDRDTEKKTGHLRDACGLFFGSEGGYAAVRNDAKKAPHAHLVENGHALRRGAKTKKNKHGHSVNIKGTGTLLGWVNGKHMYRNALAETESEFAREAEAMVERLMGETL